MDLAHNYCPSHQIPLQADPTKRCIHSLSLDSPRVQITTFKLLLHSETTHFTVTLCLSGLLNHVSTAECSKFTSMDPFFFATAPDGPPLNFSVSVDEVGLSFSWQPPTGDGLILSYTLSCSVGDETDFIIDMKPILQVTVEETHSISNLQL